MRGNKTSSAADYEPVWVCDGLDEHWNFVCKENDIIADLVSIVKEAPEDTEDEKETLKKAEDIPVKVEEAFNNNDLYLLLFFIVWANCNRLLAYTVVFSSLKASLSSTVTPLRISWESYPSTLKLHGGGVSVLSSSCYFSFLVFSAALWMYVSQR